MFPNRAHQYTVAPEPASRRLDATATACTKMPRAGTVIALLAGALLLALLLWLGFWQLERARYKDVLQARFQAGEDLGPAAPDRLLAAAPAGEWQFRRSRFSGVPRTDSQYLLDNRTSRGRAGYHVLTVVRARDFALLVNRGWVPVGPDRMQPPPIDLAATERAFHGRLVPPPGAGLLLGESGYEGTAWPRVVQTVDLRRIGADTGLALLPGVLLLDAAHPDCLRCDWSPVPGVSAERHRGYALQWFSLAAALVVIVVVLGVRARSRHGG